MKNIIFIAPPAAGKGTQSEMLKEKYHLEHISTGDLLRNEAASGSEKGQYIGQIQNSGGIVDDDIVLELLENKIKSFDANQHYILDGFPRTIEQAKKYEEMVARLGREIGYVLFLDIDKERAMQRTLGRISCPNCHTIYNEYSSKFDKIGFCNKCQTKLEKRTDDNEQTFFKRFDSYIEKTKPVVEYYQSKGLLYNITCADEKEITFGKIEDVINGLKSA